MNRDTLHPEDLSLLRSLLEPVADALDGIDHEVKKRLRSAYGAVLKIGDDCWSVQSFTVNCRCTLPEDGEATQDE